MDNTFIFSNTLLSINSNIICLFFYNILIADNFRVYFFNIDLLLLFLA